MNIPDEAVEAAAKAILDTPADYPGDEEAQRWAEYIAAAAIEAAAPIIAAQALRDATESIIVPGASSLASTWLRNHAESIEGTQS